MPLGRHRLPGKARLGGSTRKPGDLPPADSHESLAEGEALRHEDPHRDPRGPRSRARVRTRLRGAYQGQRPRRGRQEDDLRRRRDHRRSRGHGRQHRPTQVRRHQRRRQPHARPDGHGRTRHRVDQGRLQLGRQLRPELRGLPRQPDRTGHADELEVLGQRGERIAAAGGRLPVRGEARPGGPVGLRHVRQEAHPPAARLSQGPRRQALRGEGQGRPERQAGRRRQGRREDDQQEGHRAPALQEAGRKAAQGEALRLGPLEPAAREGPPAQARMSGRIAIRATAAAALAAAAIAPAAAEAKPPRVQQLVAFRNGTAKQKSLVAKAATAHVGKRRCAVSTGTALAALIRSKVGALKLRDYGSCTRKHPADAAGLYVAAIAGERAKGVSGWVYKVGHRVATTGAADPTGPFGTGKRLRKGARVTWFYCRMSTKTNSCQRTLGLKAKPQGGGAVKVTVRAYNDGGHYRPVAGAAVHVRGGGTVKTGPGGTATLQLPLGRARLWATAKARVRSFQEVVDVK